MLKHLESFSWDGLGFQIIAVLIFEVSFELGGALVDSEFRLEKSGYFVHYSTAQFNVKSAFFLLWG